MTARSSIYPSAAHRYAAIQFGTDHTNNVT